MRRPTVKAATLFVAGVPLLAACGGPPGAATSTAVIDTVAGVVRVRNPAEAPPWDAESFVRIGAAGMAAGEARPDEFGQVTGVVAGADGAIYVADALGPDIRVFGKDGAYQRTIGRKGSGPGEFGTLRSVGWVGDTLVTLDAGNGRVGMLTARGDWVGQLPWLALSGTISVRPAGPGEAYYYGLLPEARRRQGRLIGWIRVTRQGPVDTLMIPRLDDAPLAAVRCDFPGGISLFAIPFAPGLVSAPAPGGHVARVWSADYRVAITTADGDTLRLVERDMTPVPVRDEEYEAELADYREARERNPEMRCQSSPTQRMAVKPAIANLFFDQEGRLVVERYTATGTAFDFYDEQGRIRGTTDAPQYDERVGPYFRDDRLYVVQRDSLGVQAVRGYRLVAASRDQGDADR